MSEPTAVGRRSVAFVDWLLPTLLHSGFGQPARRLLLRVLHHEETRSWLIHALSDRMAMREASFERNMPERLGEVLGFEDLTRLLSSNELNHGIARLRLDEASYLYRLVCSYENPMVAELGTYKGGSTFLLAAAGARVLTMDNGRLPGQERLIPDLVRALVRAGLRERVEILRGDARVYPILPDSYDVVFFDCMYSYSTTKTVFEHWWPAVRPGGALLFRDGKDSRLTEAVRFVSNLDPAAVGADIDATAPGSFVLLRKPRSAAGGADRN